MAKKQPEITDKTRQVFIDIFCELYAQIPIEKISIQEIALNSGYNRSTFYQYFCDIYDLLAYIENDVLDYILQTVQDRDKERHDSYVKDVVKLFDEKGKYLNALLGDYGSNRFLELLKTRIPLESQELELHKDNPLTPYLIEFHMSTSLSLFRLWQRRQKDLPVNELLGLVHHLYTEGISSYFKEQ